MSASAVSTRARTTSTPSGDLRSTPIERRPRARRSAGGVAGSPPATFCARSMRIDVRTHVGEHHPAERPGADAGQLDHRDAGEGSRHVLVLLLGRRAPCRGGDGGQAGVSPGVLGHVGDDGVGDAAARARRQVVAHALDEQQLGVGDDLGRALAARPVDERGPRSPWMTSVGTSSAGQRPSDRLPEATMAASWRAVPGGSCARSHSSAPARRQPVLVDERRAAPRVRVVDLVVAGLVAVVAGGRQQRADGLGRGAGPRRGRRWST